MIDSPSSFVQERRRVKKRNPRYYVGALGILTVILPLFSCTQVDFSKAAIIIRITTQGRQDYRQWVTQYYLRHSVDGVYFVDYKQGNSRKVVQKKTFKNYGHKHEGYKCLIVVLNIGNSPLTH